MSSLSELPKPLFEGPSNGNCVFVERMEMVFAFVRVVACNTDNITMVNINVHVCIVGSVLDCARQSVKLYVRNQETTRYTQSKCSYVSIPLLSIEYLRQESWKCNRNNGIV